MVYLDASNPKNEKFLIDAGIRVRKGYIKAAVDKNNNYIKGNYGNYSFPKEISSKFKSHMKDDGIMVINLN